MNLLFLFIIGSSVGSFLGLVIDRLPRDESIVFGRSHCESCGKLLRPWDLIPLFSQLLSRNRCRYCGARLSWVYFWVELSTGVLFMLPALHIFSIIQSVSLLCCLVLSIFDYRAHEFPFSVWLCFALGLLFITPFKSFHLVWLILAFLAEKKDLKIGSGDFLWLFLMPLSLSFMQLVWTIQIASLLGIIWFIIKKRQEIAFIPFLSIGYLTVLLLVQSH